MEIPEKPSDFKTERKIITGPGSTQLVGNGFPNKIQIYCFLCFCAAFAFLIALVMTIAMTTAMMVTMTA